MVSAAAWSVLGCLVTKSAAPVCVSVRPIRLSYQTCFDPLTILGIEPALGPPKAHGGASKSYGDVVVDARGKYTTAAVALILQLTNRPVYVSRTRRKAEDFPD
jgi:hypothetical protein